MHPRGLGVRAPADPDGSPFPAPLGPPRLLLAGRQLCAQALAGTQPTAAALLPQVLLLSSGLLSTQVASFLEGEPAHGRGAALLLGGQRRSYSPGCPTRGHRILCLSQAFASLPLGTQSVVGRMDGFLLSGHVLPAPGSLGGVKGEGDPGPTCQSPLFSGVLGVPVPAPGAVNSTVNETRVSEVPAA